MAVPGTMAWRFAATINSLDAKDDWAEEYGSLVARLLNERTAVETALSPAAKTQTYLALTPQANTFIVLHGLHRWTANPPSRSVNEGRLMAFEGETLGKKGHNPPDLMRFEEEEGQLFKRCSLKPIDLDRIANFYDGTFPKRDTAWFGEAKFDKEAGTRLGRLIPIPTAWAALFLDYPNLATALRWVRALISSVKMERLGNFKLLAYSMAYACFLLPETEDYTSVLAADWKRLPNSKLNWTWRIDAWKMGTEGSAGTKLDEGDSVEDRKTLPKDAMDPFLSVFGGG
jgi:hypothetical protein